MPVIGFIDLRYVNVVRELKSSGKPRRGIVDDHAFQVATYAMAIRQETGEWPKAFVDYLMPSGMSSFQLKKWQALGARGGGYRSQYSCPAG